MKVIFIISIMYFIIEVAQAQIVCDKFHLVTKFEGKSLDLFVDTDLPDNTIVMVSVSRSYKENNNNDYPINYFSEKSTIGEWRYKHIVSIDNNVWKSNLLERQRQMSRLGSPFEVSSIDDNIEVSIVVPVNQDDPKFGKGNSKLTGNKVSTGSIGDLRVVRDEVKIPYPLNFSTSTMPVLPSLDPQNLDIGQSYIVTIETPLMPDFKPVDPLKAIERMKKIPKGSVFKVLEKRVDRNTPWYRVEVYDNKKSLIGQGWISSIALLRQGVEPYK